MSIPHVPCHGNSPSTRSSTGSRQSTGSGTTSPMQTSNQTGPSHLDHSSRAARRVAFGMGSTRSREQDASGTRMDDFGGTGSPEANGEHRDGATIDAFHWVGDVVVPCVPGDHVLKLERLHGAPTPRIRVQVVHEVAGADHQDSLVAQRRELPAELIVERRWLRFVDT